MKKITTLCFLSLVLPVSAIVVQDYTLAEAAPAGLDWNYVYNYKGSSAVAVGGAWLLTAGHVADDGGDGSLPNAPGYQQQLIEYHPNADLALVRYDKAFPGYYSLYTSETPSQDLPGLEVLMVGFGITGTVSTNDYWTTTPGPTDTKRWGSEIIDRTFTKRYSNDGKFTANRGFQMEFEWGGSTNEAGGATGDSGGGVFYNDGGVWKLAGINTSVSSTFVEEETRYTGTFAVSMPDYADWIADTMNIPEPAAMGLMGFGTIGLFLYRAKRRRRVPGRSLFPIRSDEPMCDRFDGQEAGEAAGEARLYPDYLLAGLKRLSASPPAWMTLAQARYKALNKTVLDLFIAVFARSAARKETARESFRIAAMRCTDSFLEQISWDWIVISVNSGRAKVKQVLKMGVCKSLDAFLEIIPWDQMVSAYKRCKKAIRFRRSR